MARLAASNYMYLAAILAILLSLQNCLSLAERPPADPTGTFTNRKSLSSSSGWQDANSDRVKGSDGGTASVVVRHSAVLHHNSSKLQSDRSTSSALAELADDASRRSSDENDVSQTRQRSSHLRPLPLTTSFLNGTTGAIIYQETFDRLPVGKPWCGSKGASTCEVVAGRGGNVLRVSYAPSSKGTDRLNKKVKIPDCLSADLSYDVMFEEDFEWVKGGKLGAGLFGGLGTTGCQPIVPDGWSSRCMWRRNGELVMYLYPQNRHERCGDDVKATPFAFKKGVWYNIRLSIAMNVPVEENNGRAELFVDGTSLAVAENLQWRKEGANIDTFGLSTFYGGSDPSWSPRKTTHVQYDNFVVSSSNLV